MEEGFPSRYILSLVALIYPDAALFLFGTLGSHEKAMKITTLHRYDTPVEFHEQDIHASLRDWMSLWVSATEKYLARTDASVIISQKLLQLLRGKSSETAILASERFFRFFFTSRNVLLPEKQSYQYARFITDLILKSVEQSLVGADEDLKQQPTIDEKDLFGI